MYVIYFFFAAVFPLPIRKFLGKEWDVIIFTKIWLEYVDSWSKEWFWFMYVYIVWNNMLLLLHIRAVSFKWYATRIFKTCDAWLF